jgi:hypothetical protein
MVTTGGSVHRLDNFVDLAANNDKADLSSICAPKDVKSSSRASKDEPSSNDDNNNGEDYTVFYRHLSL